MRTLDEYIKQLAEDAANQCDYLVEALSDKETPLGIYRETDGDWWLRLRNLGTDTPHEAIRVQAILDLAAMLRREPEARKAGDEYATISEMVEGS